MRNWHCWVLKGFGWSVYSLRSQITVWRQWLGLGRKRFPIRAALHYRCNRAKELEVAIIYTHTLYITKKHHRDRSRLLDSWSRPAVCRFEWTDRGDWKRIKKSFYRLGFLTFCYFFPLLLANTFFLLCWCGNNYSANHFPPRFYLDWLYVWSMALKEVHFHKAWV